MKSAAEKKAPMTIARLGAAAGVGVETVLHYRRRGLLPVPASAGAATALSRAEWRAILPSDLPHRAGEEGLPHDDYTDQLSPDLDELDRLLTECPDEDEAMLLGELDGYLAGVLVSPHRIAQDEWLPKVWGGAPAAFPDDPARSARLAALVLARKAEIVGELLEGGLAYQPVYEVDTRHDEVMWEIWIDGFAAAMALGGEGWDPLLETGDEDLGAAFLGLAMYVAMARGLKPGGQDEEELLAEAPVMIPYFVETLYRRQRGLERVVMAPQAALAPPKAARNALCPCGSGRKFKKCCGAA